jgi:hypothetical protein
MIMKEPNNKIHRSISENRNDSIMIENEAGLFENEDYNMISCEDSLENDSSEEVIENQEEEEEEMNMDIGRMTTSL